MSIGQLFNRFVAVWFIALLTSAAALAQPVFNSSLSPTTIGAGNVATLTYRIDNSGSGTAALDAAFSTNLPAGLTFTGEPEADATCVGAVVSAASGGTALSFADADIAAGSTCTLTVGVAATTTGTILSGDLTSSLGNSGTASSTLTVNAAAVTFDMSFSPSSVSLGGTSTLTFTMTNPSASAPIGNLSFTDTLPAGLEIASPAKASTDCISVSSPNTTLTATPGTSLIELDARGVNYFPGFEVLPVSASCTVTVDVTATAGGDLLNSTSLQADFVVVGSAQDTLSVTVAALNLAKDFLINPANAGGTTELEFTINNFNRFDSATGVAFTDDLGAALAGLTYDSLVSNTCGGTVGGTGTTTISFSGGTVAAAGQCKITVSVAVPGGAVGGSYPNTTSTVTGTVGGVPVTGNVASDSLIIPAGGSAPTLAFEILEDGTFAADPVVSAGDDIVLRYTITNTSTTDAATDVGVFLDPIPPLPFPLTAALPANPCGAGSTVSVVFIETDDQGIELTGGSLAIGASCSFDVVLTTPTDLSGGTYTLITDQVTATIAGGSVSGLADSDSFIVGAGADVSFSKSFASSAVPGGTTTLTFNISTGAESAAVSALTFTDDLDAMLTGATAAGLPISACGGTLSGSAGDSLLTFTGGSLAGDGDSCAIPVTVNAPASAAIGSYPSITEGLSGTVSGATFGFGTARDDLSVVGLNFSKAFLDNPVIAGETTTLRFEIENVHPTVDATIISFSDNLSAALSGLAATGPASVDTCGGALSGTTSLTYVGGSVLSGQTCIIEVEVLVPASTPDGSYGNVTSSLSATVGSPITVDPASATLDVQSNLIFLTKGFTDDPVAPGSAVTLEFTLTNEDTSRAASDIAFTDDLGAMLSGTTFDSVLSNTCGGTVTGTATDIIDVSGVALAGGASCTLTTSLSVPGGAALGPVDNTTSAVTATIASLPVTGDAASDTLSVAGAIDLTFSKSFADAAVPAGGSTVLSLTVVNTGSGSVSGISFTDDLDAMLSGAVASDLAVSAGCGGGGTFSGSGFLTASGYSVAVGQTCTLTATVTAPGGAVPGSYPNSTSQLFVNGVPAAAAASDALVVVGPPTFGKSFADATIAAGFATTMTLSVDNSASGLAASSLDVTDNLPAGMVVAATPNASTTCTGGTLSAANGAGTVSYSGGSVAAGASCTVSVDVSAAAPGVLVNTTGDLTSSLGNSGSASDTLTVVPQPGFAKAFSPASINLGQSSTLTFTIDNSGSGIAASGLAFIDTLPATLVVSPTPNASTTCTGGTLSATGGAGAVSYTSGSLAASSSCTISVDVAPTATGVLNNLSGDLTSSLGNSGTAAATLTVISPEIDISGSIGGAVADGGTLGQGTVDAGAQQTLTLTVSNTGSDVLTLAAAPVISGASNVVVDSVSGPLLTSVPTGSSTTITILYTAAAAIQTDPTVSLPFSFDIELGNNDADEAPYNIEVSGTARDVTGPTGYTVSFDQDPVNATNETAISFTFAGADVGASYAYSIASGGGGTAVTGGGTIATATDVISGLDVSGLGDGTLTLTVALSDPAGNTGVDVTDTTTKDGAVPTATLVGPTVAQADPFLVTLTFSEAVTGLDLTSVALINGTASVLTGTGADYSFTVTPDHDGPVEIALNAGAAADAVGNLSTAATAIIVTADLTGTPNPTPLPDTDGDGVADVLETGDRDGDGIPDDADFDPQGYFYCEDDGRIIPGGGFTVSGPSGSNGSLGTLNDINITRDGSTGEIQWFALRPGTYSMSLSYPTAVGIPSTARLSSGTLDLTTLLPANPGVIGSSEFGTTGFLADGSLGANPAFYTGFVIEPGDPFVLSNNIPMTQCAENLVTVSASTDGAEANVGVPTDATFTITQGRISTVDTVLSYTVAGSATSGTDFTALSGTVTIAAGDTSATITVPVLEDFDIEGPETVEITLTAVTAGDLTTLLGTTVTRSATIADDDFADIAVVNVDLTTNEGGDDDASMTFALTGLPTSPVTLSFAGDSQCTVAPASMTFTAADFAVPQALTIRAIDDDKVEGTHSCQPTAVVSSADTRYDAAPLVLAAVTVTDDLVDQIREPLTEILEDDLKETITTQTKAFSRMAKGALQRLQAGRDLPCGTIEGFDVDGSVQIKDATGAARGTFGRDAYNCVTDTREIIDGTFSLNKTEDTGVQALVQFAWQRERFVSDAELSGYFLGGYFSRTDVRDLGEGTIDGFGVNGGLYGARSFAQGLFLDYYVAGAAGRHRFDIDFDAAAAPITADGQYSYLAGFAGVGVSGERAFDSFVMKPRVGLDLSYAKAGDADVTATQLGLSHDGVIDLDDFSGARATAEIRFESLGSPGGAEALAGMMRTAFTPRFVCELSSYDNGANCGVGLAFAWERTDAASGLTWGLEVDVEQIDDSRRFTFNIKRERPVGNGGGAIVTRLSMPEAETLKLEHGLKLDF